MQYETKLLKTISFGYSAACITLGIQQLITSNYTSMAGAVLVAVACSSIPAALIEERDIPLMRTTFTWNLVGLTFLLLWRLVSKYHTGSSQESYTALIVIVIFYLRLIRDVLYPQVRQSGFISLFVPQYNPSRRLLSAYEEQIHQAAGQEERNRLARDLHDSIKQQIYAIQTSAAAAQARFGSDAAGARDAIEAVRGSAREAMVEMEAMLDQLRASPLESVGLVEAIKKQGEALQYRTGAQVSIDLARLGPANDLPPGAAQSLFRIAQEALSNIARHARASQVNLSLLTDGGECVLEIRDNGSGFSPGSNSPGMGLNNMRARAIEHGGTVTIESNPGQGTRLMARVPLSPPKPKPNKVSKWVTFSLSAAAVAAFGLSHLIQKHELSNFAYGMGIGLGIAALIYVTSQEKV